MQRIYMKNLLIISVFNDGVYDLALNHLTSLKKQNITNYLAFTTGKKTYEDFSRMKFSIRLLDGDLETGEMKWGGVKFNKFDVLRYIIARKCLEQYEYVWYLDVDTVVLDDLSKHIPKTNFDCAMQDDINMPCTGCMLFKRTKQAVGLIDACLAFVKRTKHKYNDQQCVGSILCDRRSNVKLSLFDLAKFPNGWLFFGLPGHESHKTYADKKKEYESATDKTPAFVHANYMVGNQTKIDALKKHDLWFI